MVRLNRLNEVGVEVGRDDDGSGESSREVGSRSCV